MKMKNLTELIEDVIKAYRISPHAAEMARTKDPRGLKHLGEMVGSRTAKLPIVDIHEVTKWGINWDSSRFPELRTI